MKTFEEFLLEKRISQLSINTVKKIISRDELAQLIQEGITDFSEYDYSKVTNMSGLCFNGNISETPLLDTENVLDMSAMFFGCKNLTTINHLDTSSVTDMDTMFLGCTELKRIPKMDTDNVVSMKGIFDGCDSLEYIERPSDWYRYDWNSSGAPKNPILRDKYPELYDKPLRK